MDDWSRWLLEIFQKSRIYGISSTDGRIRPRRQWTLPTLRFAVNKLSLPLTVSAIPFALVARLDTVDVSPIDTSLIAHSYYGDNPLMTKDLRVLRAWLSGWGVPVAAADVVAGVCRLVLRQNLQKNLPDGFVTFFQR
jgi:hypothetical protein